MERINGFIDLNTILHNIGIENTDFSKLKNESKINISKIDICDDNILLINFSFTYKNETYYYKYDYRVNPYNELVGMCLAKDFGNPCASYDLAVLNGKQGVLSKSFRKDNAKYISGYDILSTKYNVDFFEINRYNNLESIWDTLISAYHDRQNKNEIVARLMKQIVNIFIFDIISCQHDRYVCNWELVEEGDDVYIAPLYDNEGILREQGDDAYVSLTVDEVFDNSLFEEFCKFQSVSSCDFRNLISEKIWIISAENLLSVFERIKNLTGCDVPTERKEYYLRGYDQHKKLLEEIILSDKNEKNMRSKG